MENKGKIGVTTENIFPVIKQFLYSDHEIFLRELVANAVDATQKLKALASSGDFKGETGDLKVRIELDEKKKTLKVIDSGIGMTQEEVGRYINQIAFSSAGEFLEKYKDQVGGIIGHFGLGFYSAFMVSKKVTIETLSWKEGATPVIWSCDGSPEYTMKACKKVLPYFDIPIQYGNDAILKLMNRRGSVKLIREKIDLIRKYFDDAYIRTTLIVGFPHETKETFEDTMTLVKDIRFDSLGAFTYSPEEDTKAYEMDEQVDEELKQQRYDELMSLQQKIAEEKNQSRVGKTYEVLVERYESLFDRYVARSYMSAPDGIDGIIYIRSEDELQIGDFYEVEISGYKNYDLTAIMKKKR